MTGMEYELRMGRVKNIKNESDWGCSECGECEWLTVVISLGLYFVFWMERG